MWSNWSISLNGDSFSRNFGGGIIGIVCEYGEGYTWRVHKDGKNLGSGLDHTSDGAMDRAEKCANQERIRP